MDFHGAFFYATAMTDHSYKLVAGAALIDADNRVLIQKRPEGKPLAGFWEFPGGKVEGDETPQSALTRELLEELAITTVDKAFFPLSFITPEYDHTKAVVLFYGCRNWKGPAEPQEGQELAWVKPVRLVDYNLLPANKDIIPLLRDMV